MKKHLIPLLIILALGLIGIKSLFHSGLYTAHDIWHQVARLHHYYQSVLAGQFPPYWVGNLAHGLGYPLFFFSYHLPWLIGLPFLLIGFTIPLTIKLLFILSFLFSGFALYFLLFEITNSKLSGLLSALIYLYLPLHLRTILVSAAMGVAWTYVFVPLFIFGLWRLYHSPKSRSGFALVSFATAGLILSHLISIPAISLLLLPLFLFLFSTIKKNYQKTFFIKSLLAILTGLGISAFYLIPAIYYQQFTKVANSSLTKLYQTGFPDLKQLLYSPWGYGIIGNDIKSASLSFQLGIVQWLAIIFSLIFIVLSV